MKTTSRFLVKFFTTTTTHHLETFRVSPPPGAIAKLSIPPTFLDMFWYHFHPMRQLIFYEHPCPKYNFLESVVPKLKHSLSLTLENYLPLAGNLLYPLNTEKHKPTISYTNGDSVSLTISESNVDFDYLVGNQARDADLFYNFVPQWNTRVESEYLKTPVFALQITLFPGRGLCIGGTSDHLIGDLSSVFQFMSKWASINKHGEDYNKSGYQSMPIFDRSLITDPKGINKIYWNVQRHKSFKSREFPLPTGLVRATFTLKQTDINKLKHLVRLKKNLHTSSLVVATAYAWTCFVKSGECVEEDEFFTFPVDIRKRIDPPIPENYFGNCLVFGKAKLGQRDILGSEGFVLSAMAIAEEIKRVNDKDEVLKDAENWMEKRNKIRAIGLSGSPKFDMCSADFGWGRGKKLEVVTIDEEKYAVSVTKSGDFDGGLEFGLSLPKERMEIFASIFADGLRFP